MKRFYTSAQTHAIPDGFHILLDGKPVKTPKQRLLLIPTVSLAEAVAEEWRAQVDTIRPRTMALTMLCNIACDVIPDDREIVFEDLLAYAETDLLCYRAEDAELAALQTKRFDPILAWVKRRFGVELQLAAGVIPVKQPSGNRTQFQSYLASLGNYPLSGIMHATRITGSLFLALALYEQELNAEQVFLAARLDDMVQAEAWGKTDAYVQKQDEIQRDITALAQFFVCLQG